MKRLANAPTLAEQRKQWDSLALVHFIKQGPSLLVWLFSKLLALLLFNRYVFAHLVARSDGGLMYFSDLVWVVWQWVVIDQPGITTRYHGRL
jgi:hypothetical protein